MVRGARAIHNASVSRNRAAAVLFALLGSACAHAAPPPPAAPAPDDREVVAVAEPAPVLGPLDEDVAPRAPQRLSRTITLGQTEYAPMPTPGAAQAATAPIVVNNNVTVVNQPPPIYGSRGYGYGSRFGSTPITRGERVGSAPSMWSHDGWGGAQRTAPPGRTPGVGGNWAPPPSYGPRAMR